VGMLTWFFLVCLHSSHSAVYLFCVCVCFFFKFGGAFKAKAKREAEEKAQREVEEKARLEAIAKRKAWRRANPAQAVRCSLPSFTFFLFRQNCEPLSASSRPLLTLPRPIRELDETWQWLYLSSATILEKEYLCSSFLIVYLHFSCNFLFF